MQEIYLSLGGVDEGIIAWEEYYTGYIPIMDAMKRRKLWVTNGLMREPRIFNFRLQGVPCLEIYFAEGDFLIGYSIFFISHTVRKCFFNDLTNFLCILFLFLLFHIFPLLIPF